MATYPDSLLILNGKSAGNDLLRQAIQGLRDDGAVRAGVGLFPASGRGRSAGRD